MEAGKLNRRIQIQQQTAAQDSFGQPSSTWNTIYTCWASIDIQGSQLIYATSEFVSKVTHRITFRWTNAVVIQPNMRIVYTEQTTGVVYTYNVEALLNTDQRNRELTALCYELNASE
jgi:SPP1 family predicted phage head-tail adaptor